jgi:chromosome segregation ATPase
MACSLIKKGVIGATLGAGALYLAFGTSAPSYVRTAAHRVRHNVKDALPDQFQIDRARIEVDRLEPAIKDSIEHLARTQVEVEYLEKEIASTRANHENEKVAIKAMRNSLETGDLRLAGNLSYTPDEVKGELARRFDHYKNVSDVLESKEATLKAKHKEMVAYRQQLAQMASAKRSLMSKIDGIEARLKMIETTKQGNEFNFDESALSRAKASVADLEKRIEVMSRKAEMEGKYSDSGLPVGIEPGRDVLREMDAEFGPPASKPAPGEDKSL